MAEISPTASVELAVIEFPGSKFTGEIAPRWPTSSSATS